jgi:hypothetical protein
MSYRRNSEAALRWRKWRLKNRAAIEKAGITEKALKDGSTISMLIVYQPNKNRLYTIGLIQTSPKLKNNR